MYLMRNPGEGRKHCTALHCTALHCTALQEAAGSVFGQEEDLEPYCKFCFAKKWEEIFHCCSGLN